MSDVLFYIIILLCAVLLIWQILCFLAKTQVKIKAILHRWYFLVRWWLIGKYHCDIPPSYKKFWYICNRAFWLVIFLSVAYTLFVGILGWK